MTDRGGQVDGKFAYAGSENLGQTSLDENREVGLVVTEPENLTEMHATIEGRLGLRDRLRSRCPWIVITGPTGPRSP